MATADFVIKSGDTAPVLTDTLTYSDGSAVNLTGATVTFVLRSLQATSPVSLTGIASVTSATTGAVQFAFSAADTANWGDYQATWVVTLAGGTLMSFPTVGYLNITVEQSLATAPQQLVSVSDAKEYLNIPGSDRTQDAKLTRFINSLRPVVESITGPIIPQQFDEWHDGGSVHISLRHKPRTGYGTSPLLTLLACSEYNGPVEWPLAIVASPDLGQLYSVMLNARLGRVTRRTAGGETQPFPLGEDKVHVIYEAGQNVVPANVYEGTLELIRVNFQRTQQSARSPGPYPVRDDEDEMGTPGAPLGFLVPGRVRELLSPTKRFPSLA